MGVEGLIRDVVWRCIEQEHRVERQVADLAYLGSQLHHANQLFGRKVTVSKVRSLYRLMSRSNRRGYGGRPRKGRTIERMPYRRRVFLLSILQSYLEAMSLGADPVDAKIASWKVFDAEREAGLHDVDERSMSLPVWLLFLEMLRNRRASVFRCGVCGTAVISVDNTPHMCAGGDHLAVNEAPYFQASDGSDVLLHTVF